MQWKNKFNQYIQIMARSIPMIIVALFVLGPAAYAHSIQFEIKKQAPVVSVHAFFSETSPLAGSSVTIYAPGEDQPYQTGQTDRQGFFAFVPSVAGEWVLEIDDGHGHMHEANISIDENFMKGGTAGEESPKDEGEESDAAPVMGEKTVSPAGIPLFYKIIFGLALIFGITGIYYGVRAKQSAAKTE